MTLPSLGPKSRMMNESYRPPGPGPLRLRDRVLNQAIHPNWRPQGWERETPHCWGVPRARLPPSVADATEEATDPVARRLAVSPVDATVEGSSGRVGGSQLLAEIMFCISVGLSILSMPGAVWRTLWQKSSACAADAPLRDASMTTRFRPRRLRSACLHWPVVGCAAGSG